MTAALNGAGPTAATEWKAGVELVTLPSGNKAELRDLLSLYDCIRTGLMTAELLEAFNKAQAGELADDIQAARLQDVICTAMFVRPRIGDGEGELTLSLLPDADIDYVVERAFGGAPDQSFPADGGGAGDGADGAEVRDDTVGADGDPGGKSAGADHGSAARPKAARKRPRKQRPAGPADA